MRVRRTDGAEPKVSQAELARRLGVSRAAVAQGLRRMRTGLWR
ncbi:MAG: winged helix-turn-helix domain-containing protein [Myxococcaceae bacterium]